MSDSESRYLNMSIIKRDTQIEMPLGKAGIKMMSDMELLLLLWLLFLLWDGPIRGRHSKSGHMICLAEFLMPDALPDASRQFYIRA